VGGVRDGVEGSLPEGIPTVGEGRDEELGERGAGDDTRRASAEVDQGHAEEQCEARAGDHDRGVAARRKGEAGDERYRGEMGFADRQGEDRDVPAR
jgi:hypothetical protein